MGTKVEVPILVCVLGSQAWRRSTDQGRQGKSCSATRWIIPKVDKHFRELPVHYREAQAYFF